jgi:RimJ/RimL family protein N-acetyltransferase
LLVLNAPRLTLLALDPTLAALQAGHRAAFFNAIAVAHEAFWPPAPFEQHGLDWAASNLAHDPEGAGWYGWALLTEDGESRPPRIAGLAALIGRPDDDGDVELAFGLTPDMKGRGLGQATIKALASWALANGARRVVVHLDAEDLFTARTLQKSGFADTNEPPYPGVARWALAA